MAQMDLTHPAGEWRNGLFSGICGADNAGLCLGSWFCSPCLYGQTTARLEQFPNPESPDFVGGNCFLMYAAGCCGFNWVVALMKRKEVREKFGIIGNTGMDCLASCFCFPCTLAQMETEVKDRAKLAHNAGVAQPYAQQQGGMVYQQPIKHEHPGEVHHQQAYPQQQNGFAPAPAHQQYPQKY